MLLAASFLAAAVLVAPGPARSEAESAHLRMTGFGFTPLAEMTFGARDVRRAIAVDPYGGLPIPGIELERHRDGRRTLRAQYRDWTGPAYPVTAGEWKRIAALEPAAFAPPGENTFKRDPGVAVHCWSGVVEASPDKAATWWACNAGTRATQRYTEAVLELALAKKDCPATDGDILWRFTKCFQDNDKLADPALDQRLTDFRESWDRQRERGPDILSAARRALREAEQDPSPARVAMARDAVFAFGRHMSDMRRLAQRGYTLFRSEELTDDRSRAVVSRLRRYWNDGSQDSNYIELLEHLTRLPAPPPAP